MTATIIVECVDCGAEIETVQEVADRKLICGDCAKALDRKREAELIQFCQNLLVNGSSMVRGLVEMRDMSKDEAEAFIGSNLDEIFNIK